MRAKKEKKNGPNMFIKIIVVSIFIFIVATIINIATNYIRNEITNKVNLIINNNNITKSLKFDVFIDENDTVYISTNVLHNSIKTAETEIWRAKNKTKITFCLPQSL